MTPKDLENCGLLLGKNEDTYKISGLALSSLRMAMQAFFKTYKAAKREHDRVTNEAANNSPRDILALTESFKFHYSSEYEHYCFQTVVLLQHSLELFLKDILRGEHPGLALDVRPHQHILLHKLLNNEHFDKIDEQNLNSLEFRETLERVCELIDAKRLSRYNELGFIKAQKDALIRWGKLRNRMWHRGRYVLHFSALDIYVGKYILPVFRALLMYFYGNEPTFRLWGYHPLFCGIDPVREILRMFDVGSGYEPKRMALLKEMGRAAFENPPYEIKPGVFDRFLEYHRHPVAAFARRGIVLPFILRVCPVCGAKSLIHHFDTAYRSNDDGEEVEIDMVASANCFVCTLALDVDTGDPEEFGFSVASILGLSREELEAGDI